MKLALMLHLLGAVVWIGGMFLRTTRCGRLPQNYYSRRSACRYGLQRLAAFSDGYGFPWRWCWAVVFTCSP